MKRPDPKTLAIRALRETGEATDWYQIKNNAGTPEVLIYGEIGVPGVDPEQFVRDLSKIKSKRLTVRIHSVGGDAFDGMAIYNGLKRHPAHVTTIIDGIAASAASFIAQAGDERGIHATAEIMIHPAYGLLIGDADEFRHYADTLDKTSDAVASIYADRAGGTVAEWRGVMKSERWYSSREALEAGLVDRIVEDDQPPADSGLVRVQTEASARLAEVRAQVTHYMVIGQQAAPDEHDELRAQIAGYLNL